MAYIQWTPQLDVKVDAMNREHQRLIELMNRLHELHSAGAGIRQLDDALVALGNYTVEHFKHEEAFMERIGFEGLVRHQLIHRTLIKQLQEHVTAFRQVGALNDEFFRFLKLWLSAHIMGIDTKYGKVAAGVGGHAH